MEIRFFSHGHKAAVSESQPQPRPCSGLELIMEKKQHALCGLKRFLDAFSGHSCRTFNILYLTYDVLGKHRKRKREDEQQYEKGNSQFAPFES